MKKGHRCRHILYWVYSKTKEWLKAMVKLTKAELIVQKEVSIITYYNDNVVPLNNKLRPDIKFRPMSESRVTAICPLHGDSDPSFHYWAKKGLFNCFGCGSGGDVIRLHQAIRRLYYGENLSRQEAMKSLALMYKVPIPEETLNETQNVFQMARDALSNKSNYVVPKGYVTFAEYRQLNRRVIKSSMPMQSKLKEYANLDRMACLIASGEIKLSEV